MPDGRNLRLADAERVSISGSERSAVTDERVGQIDPSTPGSVTLYLRPPAQSGPAAARVRREDFAAAYGATTEDVETVKAFAASHDLTVGSVDMARRSLLLTGPLGALAEAFGASLALHRDAAGTVYPAREGALNLPSALAEVVTGVFGLDGRPQARTQLRKSRTSSGYSPVRVGEAYRYPAGTDGAGQTVGLIELGGGFREADLAAYFASLGITAPRVAAVPVDGGANTPGTADGPDGEVMLDIEVVGSLAPAASIAVYFAPNTDQGFIDAVTTAIHDTVNRPSVISISWGGAESTWTAQAMNQMEQAFTDAAMLGVTVTVAAGDNGSTDGVTDGQQHVDFPASAPHALACGGTHLILDGTRRKSETVWGGTTGDGATGGGISDVFAVPAYQDAAHVPPSVNPGGRVGRGVPDVGGDADPETGYAIRVDGQEIVVGGTSAVAPLWAALVARCNQALGRDAGDIHAALYATELACTDITSGSNGSYSAKKGWDACTGLGAPEGTAILAALKAPAT
jgi:kumamolisin